MASFTRATTILNTYTNTNGEIRIVTPETGIYDGNPPSVLIEDYGANLLLFLEDMNREDDLFSFEVDIQELVNTYTYEELIQELTDTYIREEHSALG